MCRRAPAEWFRGEAWMDEIVRGEGASRLQALYVTYTPGARTAWHTHPVGQVLHIISGHGWVQREGQPAEPLRAGDVVLIEPGENHWHGAAAAYTMVHLAMQESDGRGKNVDWGRQVTDAEYTAVR
jgi:quercetin dioxygenase-like cupin family protein